ncbi:TetR/AcrR family transcriptional regulator [Compostibacter hankyongensis]|uniref:HTH tetR-type domain-containing protein n=1 Tax=Compostibacter hankyongensis TaxID=1007089 RepID=A0ABP8FM64_9BACT
MSNHTQRPHPGTADPRRKIIDAALWLFAAKGYARTTVDSIAGRAKVSKGLIYYYFKGKGDILKGIFSTLIAESEAMFEDRDQLSPQQFLKQISDYSFRFILQETKLLRLTLALTVQPEVVKGLKNELEYVRKKWIGEMTRIFADLGYADPEAEVYLLCALFDGVGLSYVSMPDYPIQDIQHLIEKKYGLTS